MNDKDSIEYLNFLKEQIKAFEKLTLSLKDTIVFLKERGGYEDAIEKLEKEILEAKDKIDEHGLNIHNMLKLKIEINKFHNRRVFVSNTPQPEKKAAEEPTSETADKKASKSKGSKSKKKRQPPNVEKEIDDVQLLIEAIEAIEADEAEIVVKKDEEALEASNQQKAEDLVSLEDKKKMKTETKKVEKTWSSRVGNPIEESKKKPETVVSDKVVPEEVVPGETGEGVWYNRDGKSFLFIKPGPKVCHVYATHGFCKCGDFTTYEHRQLSGINYNKLFNEKTNSWIYVAIPPKKGDFLGLPLWVTRN
jgi:hypothetical protein